MIIKEELNDAIMSATSVYFKGGISSRMDESKSERNARLFVRNLKAFLEEIDGSLSVSELREALAENVNEEDT